VVPGRQYSAIQHAADATHAAEEPVLLDVNHGRRNLEHVASDQLALRLYVGATIETPRKPGVMDPVYLSLGQGGRIRTGVFLQGSALARACARLSAVEPVEAT
jgi:hypothetical protein